MSGADEAQGVSRATAGAMLSAVTSIPGIPEHDGSDLAELREEIDALKAIPHEEIVSPVPRNVEEREPDPHATDPIGGEEWDRRDGEAPES